MKSVGWYTDGRVQITTKCSNNTLIYAENINCLPGTSNLKLFVGIIMLLHASYVLSKHLYVLNLPLKPIHFS